LSHTFVDCSISEIIEICIIAVYIAFLIAFVPLTKE